MFQTIFLPHQHGRSALDTSRTLFLLASTQGVSCRLVMNHLINMYMFSLIPPPPPPQIYVSKCMYVYVHISLFLPECACTTIIDISPRIFKLIYCCCVSIIIVICICPPGHRHLKSGPPFFLIWSLPRLWYGSLSGSISLNHLSICYNISCYNSLVLITLVFRSSCRITYIYIYKLLERESCNMKCCNIWINGSKIYFQTKIHTIIAGGTK